MDNTGSGGAGGKNRRKKAPRRRQRGSGRHQEGGDEEEYVPDGADPDGGDHPIREAGKGGQRDTRQQTHSADPRPNPATASAAAAAAVSTATAASVPRVRLVNEKEFEVHWQRVEAHRQELLGVRFDDFEVRKMLCAVSNGAMLSCMARTTRSGGGDKQGSSDAARTESRL
jgi:hypothetical protein